MAYDPSGDKKLEGNDIIRLLADHLGIDWIDREAILRDALIELVQKHKEKRLYGEEGSCPCGD